MEWVREVRKARLGTRTGEPGADCPLNIPKNEQRPFPHPSGTGQTQIGTGTASLPSTPAPRASPRVQGMLWAQSCREWQQHCHILQKINISQNKEAQLNPTRKFCQKSRGSAEPHQEIFKSLKAQQLHPKGVSPTERDRSGFTASRAQIPKLSVTQNLFFSRPATPNTGHSSSGRGSSTRDRARVSPHSPSWVPSVPIPSQGKGESPAEQQQHQHSADPTPGALAQDINGTRHHWHKPSLCHHWQSHHWHKPLLAQVPSLTRGSGRASHTNSRGLYPSLETFT